MLEWLKKWWWALIGALGGILGLLFGLAVRKKPIVIETENPEKKAAEAEAEKRVEAAKETRDKAVEEAQQAHDTAEKNLIEAQKKAAPELESDPDALNEYLKQTGKDVRGS